MARRPLHAVPAAEKAAQTPKTAPETVKRSISEAARADDRRALAVAIRDRVALALSDPKCPTREIGVLLKHLDDAMKTISDIDAAAERSGATSTATPAADDISDSFDAAAL